MLRLRSVFVAVPADLTDNEQLDLTDVLERLPCRRLFVLEGPPRHVHRPPAPGVTPWCERLAGVADRRLLLRPQPGHPAELIHRAADGRRYRVALHRGRLSTQAWRVDGHITADTAPRLRQSLLGRTHASPGLWSQDHHLLVEHLDGDLELLAPLATGQAPAPTVRPDRLPSPDWNAAQRVFVSY